MQPFDSTRQAVDDKLLQSPPVRICTAMKSAIGTSRRSPGAES